VKRDVEGFSLLKREDKGLEVLFPPPLLLSLKTVKLPLKRKKKLLLSLSPSG
jgi:hypothetical protein